MRRYVPLFVLLAAAVVALLAVGAEPVDLNEEPIAQLPSPAAPAPREVIVLNFPPVQAVEGAVDVLNFPAVQSVVGTIDVANFPATQAVTGTVEVSNLPSGPREFQFVGVTAQKFAGDGGFAAMTAACEQEYPGSRMAYTDEYRAAINPPTPAAAAWIQARPIAYARQDNYGGHVLVDETGVVYSNWAMDCAQWTNGGCANCVPAPKGLSLQMSGAFLGSECSANLSVACSAPQ